MTRAMDWPVADCPSCGEQVTVEYVHNGVCYCWHGVHCGWGHVFAATDVYDRYALDSTGDIQ